eukprot:TRINITY_DN9121_c0_g1_i1.p1 TRINITY_DN9121_c0_g1~~TRINITY_DN9121_c0_g1_i1.p1  ORF type:complete len:501 (+),score=84.70 TRINITY_DN9121_c0_g1_i1:607-2109(+)
MAVMRETEGDRDRCYFLSVMKKHVKKNIISHLVPWVEGGMGSESFGLVAIALFASFCLIILSIFFVVDYCLRGRIVLARMAKAKKTRPQLRSSGGSHRRVYSVAQDMSNFWTVFKILLKKPPSSALHILYILVLMSAILTLTAVGLHFLGGLASESACRALYGIFRLILGGYYIVRLQITRVEMMADNFTRPMIFLWGFNCASLISNLLIAFVIPNSSNLAGVLCSVWFLVSEIFLYSLVLQCFSIPLREHIENLRKANEERIQHRREKTLGKSEPTSAKETMSKKKGPVRSSDLSTQLEEDRIQHLEKIIKKARNQIVTTISLAVLSTAIHCVVQYSSSNIVGKIVEDFLYVSSLSMEIFLSSWLPMQNYIRHREMWKCASIPTEEKNHPSTTNRKHSVRKNSASVNSLQESNGENTTENNQTTQSTPPAFGMYGLTVLTSSATGAAPETVGKMLVAPKVPEMFMSASSSPESSPRGRSVNSTGAPSLEVMIRVMMTQT